MLKTIIASALAGTLALTSVSTPAYSMDRGERNRLIIGLGALAVLGALASKHDNGRVTRNPAPQPTPDWRHGDRRDGRHDDWRHDSRNGLPSACAFDINIGSRPATVYGSACLRENYRAARDLPRGCEFTVRTQRGPREVYGARCLAENGYRVEARR